MVIKAIQTKQSESEIFLSKWFDYKFDSKEYNVYQKQIVRQLSNNVFMIEAEQQSSPHKTPFQECELS